MDSLYDDFYKLTGIVFDEKRQITDQKIQNFASKHGFNTIKGFYDSVKKDPVLLQKLVNRLSVNETYFFREQKGFNLLMKYVDLLGNNAKVLSIPCSSGEEVYTISYFLKQRGLDNVQIIGCDINSVVIEFAKNGVYRSKSFRDQDSFKQRSFTKIDEDSYEIKERYRKNVSFLKKNIFDLPGAKLGTFDVIFCRNLFIYFDKLSKIKAEDILFDLLKPGGLLIMGHADYPENSVGFERHYDFGMYYYKKPL